MKLIIFAIFILIAFSAISSKKIKASDIFKGSKNHQSSGSNNRKTTKQTYKIELVKNGPQILKDQRENLGHTAQAV